MLMEWEKYKPSYSQVSHVWILPKDSDEIKVHESPSHDVYHCSAFEGERSHVRGYYCDEIKLVSCHVEIDQALERKLEKAFEEACFKREGCF